MTQWSNNFEGGTNGSSVTFGTSGGAGNTAFSSVYSATAGTSIYDNTVTHGGSLSMRAGPQGNGGGGVQWTGTGTAPTALSSFWGRFYVYLTSYPPIALRIYTTGTAPATFDYGLTLLPTGQIQHRDLNTSVYRGSASATVLSLNTWHRLEFHLVVSNAANGQSATAKIYTGANVEGSTADETLNSGAWTGSVTSDNLHIFGAVGGSSATWQLNMDDVAISSTAYPGSTNPGGGITSTESWGSLPL
jgi:hypothetical protein